MNRDLQHIIIAIQTYQAQFDVIIQLIEGGSNDIGRFLEQLASLAQKISALNSLIQKQSIETQFILYTIIETLYLNVYHLMFQVSQKEEYLSEFQSRFKQAEDKMSEYIQKIYGFYYKIIGQERIKSLYKEKIKIQGEIRGEAKEEMIVEYWRATDSINNLSFEYQLNEVQVALQNENLLRIFSGLQEEAINLEKKNLLSLNINKVLQTWRNAWNKSLKSQ